ncbi:MAG: sulfite exporter TauE/SafE family protein [Eggerthellaceae bacterium]|nr:sulfite exporter TauE/SafE family protein [Eggerthellaceae bacterium]
MESVGLFVILVATGFVLGVLSGLLGIGGGMLTIPTFRLALGLSAVSTTATSLLVIIPTAITGALSHIREKTCIVWLGVSMGVGGACTSAIGAYLATIAPSVVVMCVAAAVIGYSAFNMLRGAIKHYRKPQIVDGKEKTGKSDGTETEAFADRPTPKKCLFGVAIGLIAGLVAGFIGVGGGFIMVPLMVAVLGVSMHQASGTSLVGIAILAIPGVIEHIILGNVQYLIAIAMCIGTIPGAIIGSKLCSRFSDRGLRLLFGVMLIIVACILVINEFVAF